MIKVITADLGMSVLNKENFIMVTHNGVFHGDDVMAAAIVSCGWNEDVKYKTFICRSRDPKILERADMLFDVGDEYNTSTLRFDHHQRGFDESRDGVKYSSAGLVWREFGKYAIGILSEKAGIILSKKEIDKIISIIDEEIMKPIDAIDNGESKTNGLSFSHFISSFNANWNEDFSLADSRFSEALSVAEEFLIRKINSCLSLTAAQAIVENSEVIEGGKILVLDKFCPWIRPVFELGLTDLIFGIYENQDGTWMVQCIPPEPNSFEKRLDLPASWAGLRDNDFCVATDVSDAVFCHPGAFLCGAKSKAGALKLARLALNS